MLLGVRVTEREPQSKAGAKLDQKRRADNERIAHNAVVEMEDARQDRDLRIGIVTGAA